MASSEGKLDLRLADDRAEILTLLTKHGIALEPAALNFAVSELSEDWLVAWAMWASAIFNVRISEKDKSGVWLATWAEIVSSIFDMRDVAGVREQIRRLRIPSHEALDTSLAIRVAGRYARRGFAVNFEPNGKGCSDLLVENSSFRSYVEIKRENEWEHKRLLSAQSLSNEVLGCFVPLYHWLKDNELRLEIKFSMLFSSSVVPAILAEVERQVRQAETLTELPINAVRGSRYIVLPRLDAPFYKGIRFGRIVGTGTVVQLVPQNMPIQVVFDWEHNRDALKRRIRKASRQLANDAAMDSDAEGFLVREGSHGEVARETIRSSFSSLPDSCLGVVLLSDPGCVIPRSDVSAEVARVMGFAGSP
jgi:hypothetical protein